MSELQSKFNGILDHLISQLKLEPVDKKVVIEWDLNDDSTKITKENVFDLGVSRYRESQLLRIRIAPNYEKFLEFILVREGYYCFIPEELKRKDVIQVCINQIVENDLETVIAKEKYDEWKNLIKNTVLDRDFIYYQMDELKRFFLLKATEPYESIIQFFFMEIRNNAYLFSRRKIDDFFDFIFRHYTTKIHKALFKEEIVESLYAIIKIFHDNKKYLNIEDFYNYFTQFKEKGEIRTNLSLRKFKECLRWINKSTTIAPSYYVNKSVFGIYPIVCLLTFNPIIECYKIKKIIFSIPFLVAPKFFNKGFTTHFEGLCYPPKEYVSDLIKLFDMLEEFGYISKKEIMSPQVGINCLNLNYFLDFSHTKRLINPKSKDFNKQKEILSKTKYYYEQSPISFTIPEFLLLNRISNVSITGLTFDKRKGTLLSLKESIESERMKHEESYRDFHDKLQTIKENETIYKQFQELLKANQHFGSIYIYEWLTKVFKYVNAIENLLLNHPEIHNILQLKNFLTKNYISYDIEENIIYQDPELIQTVFTNIIPKYFLDKRSFEKEVENVKLFSDAISACYKLLIFDVKDILYLLRNPKEVERIYLKKRERVQKNFSSSVVIEPTNEQIESTIEKFLSHSPPIIQPNLHNTIIIFPSAEYFIYCLLEDIPLEDDRIKYLRTFFPRQLSVETKTFSFDKKLTYLEIFTSNIKEKDLLLHAINSLFGDHLLEFKRFFWRGHVERIGLEERDIFEFHKGTFFYKEGFFNQIFLFIKQILNNKKYKNLNNSALNCSLFFSSTFTMDKLIKAINLRISREKVEYNLDKINNLTEFREYLESNLIEVGKFIECKSQDYFNTYISSIKFVPQFSRFGLSQYDLVLGPSNFNLIDFKLLLSNTFQEVSYPVSLDPYQIMHIKYIFPYRNPNKSYLNWLVGSKKCIREYCLFHRKGVYSFKNFSRNLDQNGWNYSSTKFEEYIQNVLFNPSYYPDLSFMRNFVIEPESYLDQYYNPQSKEFKALTQIYAQTSIDIKSYLGTNKLNTIKNILSLLEKNLIFPYLLVKNLNLRDKITFIIPDLDKSVNEKLIGVFSFFNICNIFEIEGEYYIFGFDKEKFFENGLLIEIWFPNCELDEFFDAFDRLFEYFRISYYITLTDMVEGTHLLKKIYGSVKFLKRYNPLKNLKWNEHDQKWMNIKLFKEKFEPLYPELISKKDSN